MDRLELCFSRPYMVREVKRKRNDQPCEYKSKRTLYKTTTIYSYQNLFYSSGTKYTTWSSMDESSQHDSEKKSKPQKTTYSVTSFLEISKTKLYSILKHEHTHIYINVLIIKMKFRIREARERDGGAQRQVDTSSWSCFNSWVMWWIYESSLYKY